MLKIFGFLLLENLVALGLLASLGLALYRLQLAELFATQQLLNQQYLAQAANSMVNQIYADVNYPSAELISRSATDYIETSYSDHTLTPLHECSRGNLCSASQYAAFALYQWKQLIHARYPNSVFAIVCRDSSFRVPTLHNPNCNSHGGLVIKIIWPGHSLTALEAVVLGKFNSIVLAVPGR